jgi:hypothetical protein
MMMGTTTITCEGGGRPAVKCTQCTHNSNLDTRTQTPPPPARLPPALLARTTTSVCQPAKDCSLSALMSPICWLERVQKLTMTVGPRFLTW